MAIRGLGRLSDPDVADAMTELGIGYVAIGTTSLYWDSMVGYDLDRLLAQPELSVALRGSDMVVLEYRPVSS